MIHFRVEGEPVGQPRPRAFARNFGGGKWQARMYDPGTAESWKSCVALAARRHIPREPIPGPIAIEIDFEMPRPKAHYRSGKHANELRPDAPTHHTGKPDCGKHANELRPDAPTHHTGKPDCDNLLKAVLDALTQIGMWRDDSQVAETVVRKRYTNLRPGADVTIRPLAAEASGLFATPVGAVNE